MFKKIASALTIVAAGAAAVHLDNKMGNEIESSLNRATLLTEKPENAEKALNAALPTDNIAIKSENIERPTIALTGHWKADHTIYSLRSGLLDSTQTLKISKDGAVGFSKNMLLGKAAFNISAEGKVTGTVLFMNLDLQPTSATKLAAESGFCKLLNFAAMADQVTPRKSDLMGVQAKFCPTPNAL